MLVLARQRSQARMPAVPPSDGSLRDEYAPNELMWMDAATRQYKYLREARIVNERLRSQVLSQMQVIKNLTRLAQRAQCGFPSELIPRAPVSADGSGFWVKRQKLLDAATEMCDVIERVFAGEPFKLTDEELSDSTTYRYKDFLFPPRAPLASGFVRRYAPHSVADVCQMMWSLDTPSEQSRQTFAVDFVESATDRQIVQGTIRIGGIANAQCVIICRLRVWDSTRCSIVFASSLWPNPANESPWDCVGMDTKQWIDIRESKMASESGPLTEVRCSIEACKLSDSPYTMTPQEANQLQGFVAKTVEFTMNCIQTKLDDLVLRRSRSDAFESS